MTGGSILAIIGGLIALLAPNLLPFITVDEEETVVHGFQVLTGQASLVAAILTIGLAAFIIKKRVRMPGWAIALLSLMQIGLMWLTYSNVWNLTPAKSLGLIMTDPQTGGLIDQTLVTLDWGLVLVVLSSVISLFGGLLAAASHAEYEKTQRFLRVMLTWDGHIVYEKVMFVPAAVTVGEADDTTFQVAANGLSKHALPQRAVKPTHWTCRAAWPASSISAARQKMQAAPSKSKRAICGVLNFENGVDLVFQFTGAESGILASTAADRDVGLAVSLSAVATVAFALIGTMLLMNARNRNRDDQEGMDQKARELIEVNIEEIQKIEEKKPDGDEEEKTAKKAANEEGKFGDPDKDKPSKLIKLDAPMKDKIDVRNLGIAKLLGGVQAQTGALGQIMAGDTGALNSKMAVAMNGDGAELVIGAGAGGMGFRGTGAGGGGDGLGRIQGLGNIDTGGGTGRNANLGIGRKTSKKVAKLNIATGQSTGGCDKGDIAKNVRSRAASLRSCYEMQLMNKPDLQGKVTVQWTITGDGSVTGTKAVSDSMSNNAVTDCVLRAIGHIRFAKPEAGICVIQWPFVFSPG